jgi:hypothetical protein
MNSNCNHQDDIIIRKDFPRLWKLVEQMEIESEWSSDQNSNRSSGSSETTFRLPDSE